MYFSKYSSPCHDLRRLNHSDERFKRQSKLNTFSSLSRSSRHVSRACCDVNHGRRPWEQGIRRRFDNTPAPLPLYADTNTITEEIYVPVDWFGCSRSQPSDRRSYNICEDLQKCDVLVSSTARFWDSQDLTFVVLQISKEILIDALVSGTLSLALSGAEVVTPETITNW